MPLPDFTKIDITGGGESKKIIVGLLQAGLTAKGYGGDKLRVIGSDPLIEAHIPCVAVNRTNDSLQGDSLGQSEASWFDDGKGVWIVQKAVYYEESLEIRVWHKNSDERDKLAGIVKGILTASIDYLANDQDGPAFVNIKVGGGRDEQENNTPFGPLFWSAISLYFWNPMEVTITTSDTSPVTDIQVTASIPQE